MVHEIHYDKYVFSSANTEIISINTTSELSVSAPDLSAGTFEAIVICDDEDLINFKINTPVIYYADYERKAIFYLREIERTGERFYKLYSATPIARLAKMQHYGGIYTGQTLAEVVAHICGGNYIAGDANATEQAGINSEVPYIVKHDLREIKLYGWLPIASSRDNLAQVIFAIGGCCKTDLDGILRIEYLWDGISGLHGTDEIFQGHQIEYGTKVTEVSITEHQYLKTNEEVKSLFEGTTQEGDLITFDAPVYDLYAEGFSILQSDANYAQLSAGSGILYGREYKHNTRVLSQELQESEEPNIVSIDDATLVTLINSENVLKRVAEYYRHFERLDLSTQHTNEQPGDVYRFYHPYKEDYVPAMIEEADLTMSSFTKADEIALVDYIPPKSDAGYEQVHVILDTVSNSQLYWTVPANVTQVNGVCIAGGDGGRFGQKGKSGEDGPSEHTASASGVGGDGGTGGTKGVSGKVYEGTLKVTPGTRIAYTIGRGGLGGIPVGVDDRYPTGFDPSPGGETTFGILSSAIGTVLESGYTDIVTGLKYAIPAESDGVTGGVGGSTGKAAESVRYGSIVYAGGVTGKDSDVSGEDPSYWSGGGGGGGAAVGGIGGDGGDGVSGAPSYGGRGGDGGAGANVFVKAVDGAVYGQGGSGGHGGGGGGGGGYGAGGDQWASAPPGGTGGDGGTGGYGGAGAHGCVILTYMQPIVSRQTGPLITADGKYFLDKNGRRFVV